VRLAWCTTALVAGCSLNINFSDTHYRCGASGECPSGQQCVTGVCVAPGVTDAPATTDAAGTSLRCGTLFSLHDTFDAATPWWGAWTDGGPSAALQAGDLAITIPAGSADLWAGYSSNFMYDFTESAIEVEVKQVGGVDTDVELRGPNNEKVQVLAESGMLQALVLDTTTGAGTKAMIPYDATAQRWWRLRESAGTTYWEYSADGMAWTELWHQADPFPPDDVYAELAAGGEQTSGAQTARFGSVNLGEPVASACGADTLIDDFAGSAFPPKLFTWNDTGATVTRSGGVVVAGTNGTTNIYAGIESSHLYDLRDHAIYIDATTIPQVSTFMSFFQLLPPGGNQTAFEISVDGTTLNTLQRIAGTNTSYMGTTYNPAAHRYWRFRAASNVVYFEASADATTWTQLYSAPAQIDLSALIVIGGVGEYGTVTAHSATFGGINTP
jgi:hypothetical protein